MHSGKSLRDKLWYTSTWWLLFLFLLSSSFPLAGLLQTQLLPMLPVMTLNNSFWLFFSSISAYFYDGLLHSSPFNWSDVGLSLALSLHTNTNTNTIGYLFFCLSLSFLLVVFPFDVFLCIHFLCFLSFVAVWCGFAQRVLKFVPFVMHLQYFHDGLLSFSC